jgi:hypothetical protein
VRVRSAFDPSRTSASASPVLPGIAVTALAGFGTPAVATRPSANVGQSITVAIPAATQAIATERFRRRAERGLPDAGPRHCGSCTASETAVAGQVATGMASMSITCPVPPRSNLRVPRHGCADLQIVPRITGLNRSAALGQSMGINGSGFAAARPRSSSAARRSAVRRCFRWNAT